MLVGSRWLRSFLLGLLVPFSSNSLLPVLVFRDFVDPVLDDFEGQFYLLVLHVFVVVELVGELEEVINLLFLFFLLLLRSCCPSRLRLSFLAPLARSLRSCNSWLCSQWLLHDLSLQSLEGFWLHRIFRFFQLLNLLSLFISLLFEFVNFLVL